jgi:hypothetical protein
MALNRKVLNLYGPYYLEGVAVELVQQVTLDLRAHLVIILALLVILVQLVILV